MTGNGTALRQLTTCNRCQYPVLPSFLATMLSNRNRLNQGDDYAGDNEVSEMLAGPRTTATMCRSLYENVPFHASYLEHYADANVAYWMSSGFVPLNSSEQT